MSQFIQNKYLKCYNNIICNATVRKSIEGYTESHHILPRSMGGSNEKANLVNLTAREHFICHILLTKCTINIMKHKMLSAVMFMKAGK